MSISKKHNRRGWNNNTVPCCVLKTMLRSDRTMKQGKEYLGVIRRDGESEEFHYDVHYTFIEVALSSSAGRRNVRIYEGQHITCTKRLNGTIRLNFKNLRLNADFSIDTYCLEVANEIRQALKGLVEEGE